MIKAKTLKIRIKDKHSHHLDQRAKDVNFVWNYYNELSTRAIRERSWFMSGFDLQKYTRGCSRLLSIDSTAIQQIAEEYATRRKQFKKATLRWRRSGGPQRSLGWIPFKKGAVRFHQGQIKYAGSHYKIWDSYGLSGYELRAGNFSQDARGRWYLNVVVHVKTIQGAGTKAVGIDLGCKTAATDSNGITIAGREYRKLEASLGIAQRARNKQRVKAIHAKIKNRRADALHKYSRTLVDENAAIFVGNVSSLDLAKTRMAKSVLDAGWGSLKTMLAYKCDHAGIVFEEINESYTTQMCSCCGEHSSSSPKGRAGLRIREWTCECGVTHDRDINAARNILALGLERLAGEKVAA
jgi:IS605 OrfB family transposase